jgi:hypothetical protein
LVTIIVVANPRDASFIPLKVPILMPDLTTLNTWIQSGISFEEYMSQWKAKNAVSMRGLDRIQRRYRFYSKYNLERQERVDSEWQISTDFKEAVLSASGPSTWLFITDDWCVDSAYSLPLVREAAALRSSDISLHILLKDEAHDVIDQFLTDGKRSIPKFISISDGGEVEFEWGPQPEAIRLIRKDLIDSNAEGSVVSGTTIDWYADSGWLEVEKELTVVFNSAR